jgi:hypothetical protein
MMTILFYKKYGHSFFGIDGVWDIAIAELTIECIVITPIVLAVIF